MRIRSWMFAVVGLSLFCLGCGEKKPETPPPGVDTNVSDLSVDIEGGEMVSPDEIGKSSEGGDAAGGDDSANADDK